MATTPTRKEKTDVSTANHEQQQKPAQGASSKACALFKLGRVVSTPGANDLLDSVGVSFLTLMTRHVSGDFGNVCAEDWEANTAAIEAGARILSAYEFPAGKVWVITEADRSATTFLLPSEY